MFMIGHYRYALRVCIELKGMYNHALDRYIYIYIFNLIARVDKDLYDVIKSPKNLKSSIKYLCSLERRGI